MAMASDGAETEPLARLQELVLEGDREVVRNFVGLNRDALLGIPLEDPQVGVEQSLKDFQRERVLLVRSLYVRCVLESV